MAASAPILYFFISLVSVWMTMIVPYSTLFAWIFNQSVVPYLIPSLILTPFFLVTGKWVIRRSEHRAHFWIMQLFGAGCIALTCICIGSVLNLLMDYQYTAYAVFFVTIYVIWHAINNARIIKNVDLEIECRHLSQAKKIVHLSDVHIGSRDRFFLNRVVAQAKAHHPEFVVITGDLVDCDSVTRDDLAALREFQCPVYMSTGNHEFDINVDRCIQAIEAQGVILLRDSAMDLGDMELIGIDDRKRGKEIKPVLEQLSPRSDRFTLLLYHRPDGWESAQQHDIDLMLAGHTHRGQIWPFSHCVKTIYQQIAGHFIEAGKHLYVSAGTGTWGPMMRLGSENEMTVISLIPEGNPHATDPLPVQHRISQPANLT